MCEAKGIYWHADFAELRRSTYTSIILTLTQVMFFESADFVARACPATAGAGETGTHTEGTENTEIYLTQRCLCWITQNNAALRVEFTEWSLATLRLAMRGVALNG